MVTKNKTYESTHPTERRPINYNIVLAGPSGTGKSAVENMIFDEQRVITSSGPVGCTSTCVSIKGSPPGYPEISLKLVDTVGLDESLDGTVPSETAMKMLERRLNLLYSEDGVHLILFCIKKGRLSEETSAQYQVIVRQISENQIPCVLVITRCEHDEPVLGAWWEKNKDQIRNRLGYDVKDGIGVTTIKSDETMEVYNQSRKSLIEAIRKYALQEPWRSKSIDDKLRALLLSRGIGPSKIVQKRPDSLRDYLKKPSRSTSWLSGLRLCDLFSR